jgi:ribonuclease Z
VQLRKSKIKFSKINHIFISHLHGDHFYGLIGLISTFMLLNRENDLHIYGPKGIKEIILLQLRASDSYSGYNLYFHELTSKESVTVFEDEKVIVKTIPLSHRIYTNGFLFQEKNIERKLNFETIENYTIDKVYFNKIKFGGDITLEDGMVIPNSELSFPPLPVKSYAYCSDTKYDEKIIPIIQNVDYLYHESTFLESEKALSEKTMHSTAKQAATIASKAQVKNLILGHYSTRYSSIELFKEEAQTIFPSVHLAEDGKEFSLD